MLYTHVLLGLDTDNSRSPYIFIHISRLIIASKFIGTGALNSRNLEFRPSNLAHHTHRRTLSLSLNFLIYSLRFSIHFLASSTPSSTLSAFVPCPIAVGAPGFPPALPPIIGVTAEAHLGPSAPAFLNGCEIRVSNEPSKCVFRPNLPH
mgnify:CR=1 FL=1